MTCPTHPDRPAAAQCTGCGKDFCQDCLVTLGDRHWCVDCKPCALEGVTFAEAAGENCDTADTALKLAIVSLFCFGVILGPVAIAKGLSARREIQANPGLKGEGKANAAIMLGIISLLLWILGLVARFTDAY